MKLYQIYLDAMKEILDEKDPGRVLRGLDETIYNRSSMPQVSGEDLPDAYRLMKEKGIPVSIEEVLPGKLKHSQKQIDKGKVKSIIKDMRSGKKMPPCVISSDYWIVDGHHRNVAFRVEEPNESKQVIEIGLPRDEAINVYKKIEGKL